ncbi:MAG: hypothetical protein IJ092_07085 [Atopobiaceae bacterium]|nr:hypothetical protein [Atopobiaceae bacterium]
MSLVIPVRMHFNTQDLWFDPAKSQAMAGDHVVVSTERGTEFGLATRDPFEAPEEEVHGSLKPVLRIATDEDLDRADALAEKGDEAMPTFRQLVTRSGLDMKPVGVEYLFGGERVVCYFSAEERVDFRQLVRDMARELHERIDMRQIGVREEAAIIGGFAHCGQELCCARFGHQFEPVSIRMAKEQDLPLNSTKISGACGRLMCCLRYEFEAYRDFKGRAPKRNAVIETPLGKGKIVEYDTPKEQLTLRLENGKQVRVALADLEASEAAVKTSAELNCPCRPDTAPRAALERLATPEVQLALAELDREMGLVPEETSDASDIFVEPPRPRRRGRNAAPESDQQTTEAPKDEQAEKPATRTRRRRKKRTTEAEAAPAETPKTQPSRPSRRTHTADEGEQANQAQAKAPRRPRHHSTEAASQASTPARHVESEAKPAAKRPRRRPGDHGGERAQQAQQRQQAQQTSQEGGEAPKRRRRRRGGRGKGGAEGQNQASE